MATARVFKPDLTITAPPVDADYTTASPGVLLDVLSGNLRLRRLESGTIGSLAVTNKDEPTYAAKSARIRMWGTNHAAACKEKGMIGFWVYFDQLEVNDNGLSLLDIKSYVGGSAPANDGDTTAADRTFMLRLFLKNHSGVIKFATSIYKSGGPVVSEELYTIQAKTWYYVQVLWHYNGSGIFQYVFHVKPRGGAFVKFKDYTTEASVLVPYLCSIHWGMIPTAATMYRKGGPARIYGLELYSITDATDAGTYPTGADPEPPAIASIGWHWDDSGSDTAGDGSAAYPWKSETRCVNALQDGTVRSGDTIYLGITDGWDATPEAKALVVKDGFSNITFRLGNINFLATVAGTWTNTSGHVWQLATGDSTRFAWGVLLQDEKWLEKVNAANTSAATSLLEALPGSYYTDGTTWMVHTLTGDDPNGHDWNATVCRSFSGTQGGHFIASAGDNTTIETAEGFEDHIYGPMVIAKPTDGDPSIAYLVNFFGYGNGTVQNLKMAGYAKHAVGGTTIGTNKSFYWKNITVLSGTNYGGSSAQTTFVDYNDGDGTTGNIATYANCKILGNSTIPGTRWDSVGTFINSSAWMSHGTVGSNRIITFVDCDLGGQRIVGENDESITLFRCENVGSVYAAGSLIYDVDSEPTAITGDPLTVQVMDLVDEAAIGAAAQLALDVAAVDEKKQWIKDGVEVLGVEGTYDPAPILGDEKSTPIIEALTDHLEALAVTVAGLATEVVNEVIPYDELDNLVGKLKISVCVLTKVENDPIDDLEPTNDKISIPVYILAPYDGVDEFKALMDAAESIAKSDLDSVSDSYNYESASVTYSPTHAANGIFCAEIMIDFEVK